MSLSNRERLQPVLDRLECDSKSVFLDLCEMLLMFAETMPHGMIRWDNPRVLVHIRHPKKPKPAYRAECRLCASPLNRDTGAALEPTDCAACGHTTDPGRSGK